MEMTEYSLRSSRSLAAPPEQQPGELLSIRPEDLKAQQRLIRLERRKIARSLPGYQTKSERKQARALAEATKAREQRKRAKSTKTKQAKMRASEAARWLKLATDEERVTELEVAIMHVFTNKQLALDALDLRHNLENNQSPSWRLAVIGDFLLLLAPADKWIETKLTTGQWTQLRSSIEKNAQLAEHCRRNGLDKLAHGCFGGDHQLGTIIEAVLAAVYYDTNKSLDAVRGVMRTLEIMNTVDAHLRAKNVPKNATKSSKGPRKRTQLKAVIESPAPAEIVTVEISDDEEEDVMMEDWVDEEEDDLKALKHKNEVEEQSTAQLEREVAAELRQLLM